MNSMKRKTLVLLAMLGALILTACGQTTTEEKQGIRINARDGAQITRFDVQTGADGLTDLAIEWTD